MGLEGVDSVGCVSEGCGCVVEGAVLSLGWDVVEELGELELSVGLVGFAWRRFKAPAKTKSRISKAERMQMQMIREVRFKDITSDWSYQYKGNIFYGKSKEKAQFLTVWCTDGAFSSNGRKI